MKNGITQCQQTTRSNTPAGHTRLYTKYLQKSSCYNLLFTKK